VDVSGTLTAEVPGTLHQDFQRPDDTVILQPDAGHAPDLETAWRCRLFQ